MFDLTGKRVLVLGLGLSGRSAAAFCAQRGARVVAADERGAESLQDLDAIAPHARLSIGAPFPDPGEFDLVVPSPGVPAERYRARARCVWGDIELAYRALEIPLIAITGTNGKSTTTELTAAMLRAAGFRARAAGNIGTPALDLVGSALDVAVLEVSSFQLETVDTFRPDVSVILNITPDHLDRHRTLDAYIAAKARILAGQRESDCAVLNFDDPSVRDLAANTRARIVPFRTTGPLERGAWLDAGAILLQRDGTPALRLPLDAMRLAGAHNRENALAALCAASCAGADPEKAMHALASFDALPHRTQIVAERAGVTYVDDSKATNPGAACSSLASFSQPLVWIAGGRDKNLDLSGLAEVASRRVRAAVLFGESSSKLARGLGDSVEVHTVASIEEATRCAASIAQAGDVVLLSPGCSSHDQFRNFEERGQRFRAAVEGLAPAETRS